MTKEKNTSEEEAQIKALQTLRHIYLFIPIAEKNNNLKIEWRKKKIESQKTKNRKFRESDAQQKRWRKEGDRWRPVRPAVSVVIYGRVPL